MQVFYSSILYPFIYVEPVKGQRVRVTRVVREATRTTRLASLVASLWAEPPSDSCVKNGKSKKKKTKAKG